MTFNKCSIAGVLYGDIIDPFSHEIVDPSQVDSEHFGKFSFSYLVCVLIILFLFLLEPVDFSHNPFYEPSFKFYDKKLLEAVNKKDDKVLEFFRLLALCHTVMCEERENGKIVYQAQSPDEAALTSAARNFGFVFRVRFVLSYHKLKILTNFYLFF